MNLAIPILICDRSEEFRSLLREMLTKHGFFHVLEASNQTEILTLMKAEKKDYLTIIQNEILYEEIIQEMQQKKMFIIIAQPETDQNISLVARLGVQHFLSFPFSSQRLLDKIKQIF